MEFGWTPSRPITINRLTQFFLCLPGDVNKSSVLSLCLSQAPKRSLLRDKLCGILLHCIELVFGKYPRSSSTLEYQNVRLASESKYSRRGPEALSQQLPGSTVTVTLTWENSLKAVLEQPLKLHVKMYTTRGESDRWTRWPSGIWACEAEQPLKLHVKMYTTRGESDRWTRWPSGIWACEADQTCVQLYSEGRDGGENHRVVAARLSKLIPMSLRLRCRAGPLTRPDQFEAEGFTPGPGQARSLAALRMVSGGLQPSVDQIEISHLMKISIQVKTVRCAVVCEMGAVRCIPHKFIGPAHERIIKRSSDSYRSIVSPHGMPPEALATLLYNTLYGDTSTYNF
ncbi:hypothetical protein J6590_012957 [Homalodisca vitripennis]|nr:hypothetical protein J6590_012957 [Homalodisca vitripennis]